MPAISSTAPGKIILFGEHAVVYGRPAIAAPVNQVRARAVVSPAPRAAPGDVHIQAPDVGLDARLADLPEDHPLVQVVYQVQAALRLARLPALTLRITSTIPLAAGLGSGAAVSVACIRSLSAFLGRPLPDDRVSAIAYEVEKLYHGTPSGIDNTVITYDCPVYFVRGKPIKTLRVGAPFTILIGDTGIASPTAAAVGNLRRLWQADNSRYDTLFDAAGEIARAARQAIERGRIEDLGPLMDQNHALLSSMGVSSTKLDRLVQAARKAGAWGAKLSGGGRGGNMIALVSPARAAAVEKALRSAGAVRTILTRISP